MRNIINSYIDENLLLHVLFWSLIETEVLNLTTRTNNVVRTDFLNVDSTLNSVLFRKLSTSSFPVHRRFVYLLSCTSRTPPSLLYLFGLCLLLYHFVSLTPLLLILYFHLYIRPRSRISRNNWYGP